MAAAFSPTTSTVVMVRVSPAVFGTGRRSPLRERSTAWTPEAGFNDDPASANDHFPTAIARSQIPRAARIPPAITARRGIVSLRHEIPPHVRDYLATPKR